ncbi:hypothetical protein EVAR_77376_1 [Eumeta japonica]|uniref:Uncharacterized protein n=1 Tax=Eumeta variegata TaxID=151549 RepID=A0A4C1UX58_EUMVA|nr:hypothetical protein EVAR_77376_1 [Eumeta japonica]
MSSMRLLHSSFLTSTMRALTRRWRARAMDLFSLKRYMYVCRGAVFLALYNLRVSAGNFRRSMDAETICEHFLTTVPMWLVRAPIAESISSVVSMTSGILSMEVSNSSSAVDILFHSVIFVVGLVHSPGDLEAEHLQLVFLQLKSPKRMTASPRDRRASMLLRSHFFEGDKLIEIMTSVPCPVIASLHPVALCWSALTVGLSRRLRFDLRGLVNVVDAVYRENGITLCSIEPRSRDTPERGSARVECVVPRSVHRAATVMPRLRPSWKNCKLKTLSSRPAPFPVAHLPRARRKTVLSAAKWRCIIVGAVVSIERSGVP